MFIDSIREDKLERQRSLGKAPAMASACRVRDSLPGVPGPEANTSGISRHELVPKGDAAPTAETFQRNSQGARMRAPCKTLPSCLLPCSALASHNSQRPAPPWSPAAP